MRGLLAGLCGFALSLALFLSGDAQGAGDLLQLIEHGKPLCLPPDTEDSLEVPFPPVPGKGGSHAVTACLAALPCTSCLFLRQRHVKQARRRPRPPSRPPRRLAHSKRRFTVDTLGSSLSCVIRWLSWRRSQTSRSNCNSLKSAATRPIDSERILTSLVAIA